MFITNNRKWWYEEILIWLEGSCMFLQSFTILTYIGKLWHCLAEGWLPHCNWRCLWRNVSSFRNRLLDSDMLEISLDWETEHGLSQGCPCSASTSSWLILVDSMPGKKCKCQIDALWHKVQPWKVCKVICMKSESFCNKIQWLFSSSFLCQSPSLLIYLVLFFTFAPALTMVLRHCNINLS